MRLGGPIFGDCSDPVRWAQTAQREGYRAVYCPIAPEAPDATVRAYADAVGKADLVIAEVGAWSNPISPDEATRKTALEKCRAALQLADRIGARCCVNITGSLGEKWDGPFAADLSEETFSLIVDSVRSIIDAVRPTRSVYALETMPWMFPDSPDSYLKLIRAIDRPKGLGVHLDPVNLINCPTRYFDNAAVIRECFAKLGPWIRSCHAKDILMGQTLTLHLDEVRPGLGALDYPTYLRELNQLDADVPLMLEHLPNEQEYRLAAQHLKSLTS